MVLLYSVASHRYLEIFCNYFGEGYHHPPREIANGKKWPTQNIIYKSGLEYFPHPQLVPLEASRGVAALATYKIFVYILKHMENHKIVICNLCSSFLLSSTSGWVYKRFFFSYLELKFFENTVSFSNF